MLEVKNLSFSFKHRMLFKDVNFTLKEGSIMHISGPNGTGKSTLLSILAGLRDSQSGSIEMHTDGKEIEDLKPYIEYLSAEANGLFSELDAISNLRFYTKLRGHRYTDKELVTELKRWGLASRLVYKNFPINKFSTGMKRRLALARVSLSGAPIWILDEPVYGLDAEGIVEFREMIKRHTNQGGSTIIVSHDLEAISELEIMKLELRKGA